jgi:hypothetical protein
VSYALCAKQGLVVACACGALTPRGTRRAQVADVVGGRSAPMSAVQARAVQRKHSARCTACTRARSFLPARADAARWRGAALRPLQRREGVKTVPGEFSDVNHVRGIISMGRCVCCTHL